MKVKVHGATQKPDRTIPGIYEHDTGGNEPWITIANSELRDDGDSPIAMITVVDPATGTAARAFVSVRLDRRGRPIFRTTVKKSGGKEVIRKATGDYCIKHS